MDLSSLTSADTLSYSFMIYATVLRYHDRGKTAHSLHIDEDSFGRYHHAEDQGTPRMLEIHLTATMSYLITSPAPTD